MWMQGQHWIIIEANDIILLPVFQGSSSNFFIAVFINIFPVKWQALSLHNKLHLSWLWLILICIYNLL